MKEFTHYIIHEDPILLVFLLAALILLGLVLWRVYLGAWVQDLRREYGWQARIRRTIGILETTWNNLTYEDRCFIRDTWAKCNSNGVVLDLQNEDRVAYPGGESRVSGYFLGDDLGEKPRLCVAIRKPTTDWMTVLMHESSHMDQWVERCDVWRQGFRDDRDVYDVLQDWLDHKVELSADEQDDVVGRCMAIELDCEKRTLDKMRKLGMHMYTYDYVRKANAYIWSYYMVKVRRRWYAKPPYEVFEVWGGMPDMFMDLERYTSMTWEMSSVFDRHCFGVAKREVPS